MILIDFLVLNSLDIFLASILLSIFNLTDKKLYLILVIDLMLNGIPIITIILIILYKFKEIIFHHFNETFTNRYVLIIGYYFIFGIFLYGIYNGIDLYVFNYLFSNLIINLIIYYLGIKYLMDAYN